MEQQGPKIAQSGNMSYYGHTIPTVDEGGDFMVPAFRQKVKSEELQELIALDSQPQTKNSGSRNILSRAAYRIRSAFN